MHDSGKRGFTRAVIGRPRILFAKSVQGEALTLMSYTLWVVLRLDWMFPHETNR